MAYNEKLAERVRQALLLCNVYIEEKKMMGGLTFMVNDKMCVGISNDKLMVRLAPEEYENALAQPNCRPMDFTGRPMKGFVYISPQGLETSTDLKYWLDRALAYNERAPKSKKRRK